LEEGDAQKIAKAGGADFLWKVAQQTGLTAPPPRQRAKIEKVSPRPDTTGGKNSARAASWDEKYGGLYSPTTGIRYPDDESSNNAEMAKLQRQNDSGMSTPIGVESSKMEAAQSENLKGRVAYGVLKRESSNQVNTTNVNQQPDKTVPLKRAVPSVRMQEESFNEVIFSNTRPAN
jgi:hypothetical protein